MGRQPALGKRLPLFTRPSFAIPLLDSLNFYRCKQQFKLLGYVIMPDHIHLLIWPFGEAIPLMHNNPQRHPGNAKPQLGIHSLNLRRRRPLRVSV